jgi:hypothetical protein
VARRRRGRAPLRVLTTGGLQFLSGLGDREAAEVGRHWNAVRRYLDYGEDHQLGGFGGVTVAGFALETRTDLIERHAIRGDVRFESIYDEVT